MSNIFYEGSDGYIHSLEDGDSIKHWKYIKKIKSGNGYRYFYSQDEIDAYNDQIQKDKVIKDEVFKEKKIQEKKTRWSPMDAYRDEKRAEQNRIDRENKKDRLEKEIKDRWQYAKPQKPSTMSKRVVKDSQKEQTRWINERERINKETNDAFKNTKDNPYANARISARERVRFDENERLHEENKRKNADRSYNTARYRKIAETPHNVAKSSSQKIDKGRSAVEKKLNKAKNEVKGVKRVIKAINTAGEAKSKGTIYSKNGKTYRNWKETPSGTIKTYDGRTLGYDYHVEKSKKKKTGKAERTILGAYRKTSKGKRWSLTR